MSGRALDVAVDVALVKAALGVLALGHDGGGHGEEGSGDDAEETHFVDCVDG